MSSKIIIYSLFGLLFSPLLISAQALSCRQTTFVAKVRKQETSITLDVKSGKKYFLRCELPWSLAPKPKLTEVSKEEAQSYFDNIK